MKFFHPLLFSLALFVCGVVGQVWAQETISTSTSRERFGEEFFRTEYSSWIEEVDLLSRQIEAGSAVRDLRSVHDAVGRLKLLAPKLSAGAVDHAAILLVQAGDAAIARADYDAAVYFAKSARELAPRSARVLARGMGLWSATRSGEFLPTAGQIVASLFDTPDLLIDGALRLVFPFLWALVFATLAIDLLLVLGWGKVMIASAQRLTRGRFGVIPAAVVLTGAFIAPLTGGPLCAVLCWGVLLGVLVPFGRRLVIWHALLVFLWTAVVPLHQNVELYLASDSGGALLRHLQGGYERRDEFLLENLSRSRPGDPLPALVSARAYLSLGRTAEARSALARAERIGMDTALLDMHRGMLQFLTGDFLGAKERFTSANASAGPTAAGLFNLSKAQFALLDTEGSRMQLQQLERSFASEAAQFTKQAEALGEGERYFIAPPTIPLSLVVSSVLMPLAEARAATDLLFAGLLPTGGNLLIGAALSLLVAAGGLLYGVSHHTVLSARQNALLRVRPQFPVLIRIFPGGALLRRGAFLAAVTCSTIAVLLFFPLLDWPRGSEAVFTVVGGFRPFYVSSVILFLLLCPWIGFEEEQGRHE